MGLERAKSLARTTAAERAKQAARTMKNERAKWPARTMIWERAKSQARTIITERATPRARTKFYRHVARLLNATEDIDVRIDDIEMFDDTFTTASQACVLLGLDPKHAEKALAKAGVKCVRFGEPGINGYRGQALYVWKPNLYAAIAEREKSDLAQSISWPELGDRVLRIERILEQLLEKVDS